ncbi:MAG: tRNA (guanosine(46)-N7)-methyltransferase TrmB [Hyphomonas sp.]
MPDTSNPTHVLRSYGRTGGRPLSARQKTLMAERLYLWQIPAGDDPLDLAPLFPGKSEIWLEIGFGGAEHLIAQAKRHPETGFIGCEPFVEGVAKAVIGIEDEGLENVRLWPDDVRLLLARLPDASLSRVFILFPDPWPKRRQQKRRLVQPEFLQLLRPKLRPGAAIRFATDVRSYADEALLTFLSGAGFHWTAGSAADWREAPADHVTTRYESKRLGDCAPVWLDCIAT